MTHSRVGAAPSFVLSGPAGTLVTSGVVAAYRTPSDAAAALREGTADLVVGALPFDTRGPAALLTPEAVGSARDAGTAPLPRVRITATRPDPRVHRARIEAALRRLRDPGDPLQKVVLARTIELSADAEIDPLTVLDRLTGADRQATAYLADLSPAGSAFAGALLVGASPELLVARRGTEVTCQPFAGSAPRLPDSADDTASGAALAASGKNRHEHQLVVDTMRAVLEPMCGHLDVADSPQLSSTATLWHLSTPIRGVLRDPSTTALDLALALQPTPAVGGVPTPDAVDLIADLEGDRGFYAGAVGWCDARGDGRWVVAIRGAQLSADRRGAVAAAGGGIVAESDPDDEIAETTAKFRTILGALGVDG